LMRGGMGQVYRVCDTKLGRRAYGLAMGAIIGRGRSGNGQLPAAFDSRLSILDRVPVMRHSYDRLRRIEISRFVRRIDRDGVRPPIEIGPVP